MSKRSRGETLRLLSVAFLAVAAGACGKLERTVAPKVNQAAAEAQASQQLVPQQPMPHKSLSQEEAMGQLFEAVESGEGVRYIWRNFEAAPDKEMNRTLPVASMQNAEAWAMGIRELSPDRTVLVTGSTGLDESGERIDCHA